MLLCSDFWVPASFWPRSRRKAYTVRWTQQKVFGFISLLLKQLLIQLLIQCAEEVGVECITNLCLLDEEPKVFPECLLSVFRLIEPNWKIEIIYDVKMIKCCHSQSINVTEKELKRGWNTLRSGVDVSRRDSGDCMCMQSEPASCFVLGILNEDVMVMKWRKKTTPDQSMG